MEKQAAGKLVKCFGSWGYVFMEVFEYICEMFFVEYFFVICMWYTCDIFDTHMTCYDAHMTYI